MTKDFTDVAGDAARGAAIEMATKLYGGHSLRALDDQLNSLMEPTVGEDGSTIRFQDRPSMRVRMAALYLVGLELIQRVAELKLEVEKLRGTVGPEHGGLTETHH